MKYLLSIILFVITLGLYAQENNTEHLRKLGYQSMVKGELANSIKYYEKVLQINQEDYDARLAIARLYYNTKNYTKSLSYYNMIYKNDNNDVEALNGFGRCYHKLGEIDKAIFYFKSAIELLPSYLQQYFDLAQMYIEKGELSHAINTYNEILRIDKTYAEAWAGIGKMYYWQNLPETAINFYEKALELDPSNKVISEQLNKIKAELKYNVSSTFKLVNEEEDTYQITAIIQKYSVNKRLNDHFSISLNTLFDYSNRKFSDINISDSNRWFDNSWGKLSWISKHNKLSGYFGGSNNDSKITTYGINWSSDFSISKVKFKNSLNVGYDYFYYWNEVGRNYVSNTLTATYKKFSIKTDLMFGNIDKLEISDMYADLYDTSLINAYRSYGISLKYQILSKPKTIISLNHSYLDFDYKSPLYYTPYERTFNGAHVSTYYTIKKFYVYLGFGYNLGKEVSYKENLSGQGNNKIYKKLYLDVNNWSGDIELGYNIDRFNFSVGLSHIDNPYYKSTIASFSLKAIF